MSHKCLYVLRMSLHVLLISPSIIYAIHHTRLVSWLHTSTTMCLHTIQRTVTIVIIRNYAQSGKGERRYGPGGSDPESKVSRHGQAKL